QLGRRRVGRHQPRSSRSAALTPKPMMMAGSSRAEPTTRLPTTRTTTSVVRPITTPATKTTTARPKSDQPARRAIFASRATCRRRSRTGSSLTRASQHRRPVPLLAQDVVVEPGEDRLVPDPGVLGLADPVVLVGEVQELGVDAAAHEVGPQPQALADGHAMVP